MFTSVTRSLKRMCPYLGKTRSLASNPPQPADIKPLESLPNTGEAYEKSYKQFVKWLNYSGHGEVSENSNVIAKILRVVKQEYSDENRKHRDYHIIVDWGHKHHGIVPLPPHGLELIHRCSIGTRQLKGMYVVCKVQKIEHVELVMGHSVWDRHNESHLTFVKFLVKSKDEEGNILVDLNRHSWNKTKSL